MRLLAVKKIRKSVKIWQSYREFKGGNFFWDTVYMFARKLLIAAICEIADHSAPGLLTVSCHRIRPWRALSPHACHASSASRSSSFSFVRSQLSDLHSSPTATTVCRLTNSSVIAVYVDVLWRKPTWQAAHRLFQVQQSCIARAKAAVSRYRRSLCISASCLWQLYGGACTSSDRW